mmetsp:Transcript_3554/g.8556  ORF Transcript_3554/g.8556 Transcript_3554/m.8556 type:complete len:255 (+) Transcript_3554:104-868(+)
MLGADLGAVHNGVAAVELKCVVQFLQSLRSGRVPRVLDPPVGLHENSRSQVLVGVPPVGRTGRRAAGTEDALVHAVELGTVLLGLQEFALQLGVAVGAGRGPGRLFLRGLQPRLDAPVLLVKVAHVGDQVLQDIHVGERVDLGGLGRVLVDVGKAGERVGPLDVHGAGSANTLAAAPPKGQGGILLILDLEEGVENHRAAVVEIDGVRAEIRLLVLLLGIPPIHLEVLDAFGLATLARGCSCCCCCLFELGFGR